MYERILIPTDGSQTIGSVVDHGLTLASLSNAEVHALHVVDERSYLSVPDDARKRVRDTLESDADAATKAIAERALEDDLAVVREVRWGDPSAAILAYAAENAIDLIVMGTHGRTGYERYLLGSVAERVVRSSPIPVLTIYVGDAEERLDSITSAGVSEPTETGNSLAEGDEETADDLIGQDESVE